MDESFWNGVFWNHLVYPELSADETEDPTLTVARVHEDALGGRFPDFIVCLCLDDYHRISADRRQNILDTTKHAIISSLLSQERSLLGFAHTNSFYWCGVFDDPMHSERARALLIDRLESVRSKISTAESTSVTIGVAYLPAPSLSAWRTTAQLAVVAQRSKVRFGPNRIFVYDEATMSPSQSLAAYWQLAEQTCRAVRSGDLSSINESIANVSHAIFSASYLGLMHLRPILQSLIILMAQGAIEVGVDESEVTPESEQYLSAISTTYDYAQLRELLEHATLAFTTKVHARFSSNTQRLVTAAQDYIQEHLFDPDLGLAHLSKNLNTSSSYLCRIFKKTTGQGLVDYINRLRIDEARRLLLNNGLKITDIAFELGFGSVQHFGRVFRALEGCSPLAYRSKHVQSR